MKGVRWAEGLEPLLQPIDSVKQHPDNPNNGDVDAVIESIQINGFNQVITVNRATGYIEAGHTRWAALHALGSPVAPFVWVDHDDEGEARYMIADNETGKLARMDPLMESRLLTMLNNTMKGLAGTGVSNDAYLRKLTETAAPPIMPTHGFGHGVAPSGIFQVVVSFRDADERDDLLAELIERYEDKARGMNL